MSVDQNRDREDEAREADSFDAAPGFVAHLVKDHAGLMERRARPRATFAEAQRAYAATASRLVRRMPSGWRRATEA